MYLYEYIYLYSKAQHLCVYACVCTSIGRKGIEVT